MSVSLGEGYAKYNHYHRERKLRLVALLQISKSESAIHHWRTKE